MGIVLLDAIVLSILRTKLVTVNDALIDEVFDQDFYAEDERAAIKRYFQKLVSKDHPTVVPILPGFPTADTKVPAVYVMPSDGRLMEITMGFEEADPSSEIEGAGLVRPEINSKNVRVLIIGNDNLSSITLSAIVEYMLAASRDTFSRYGAANMTYSFTEPDIFLRQLLPQFTFMRSLMVTAQVTDKIKIDTLVTQSKIRLGVVTFDTGS